MNGAQALPSDFLTTAKPLGRSGSPLHSYTQFKDKTVTPNTFRDYVTTAEVIEYLSNASSVVQAGMRAGGFEIFVNSGGTLANGVITGGTRNIYWFKDGVADNNLVLKQANVDLSGYITKANSSYYNASNQVYPSLAAGLIAIPLAGRNNQQSFLAAGDDGLIFEYYWPDPADLNDSSVAYKISDQLLSGKLTAYQRVRAGIVSDVAIATNGLQITLTASAGTPIVWQDDNGNKYHRTTNAVFNIVAAGANKVRKDIIVGGGNEVLQLVQGMEAASVPVTPDVPDGFVLITSIDVFGSTVAGTASATSADLSNAVTAIEAQLDNKLNVGEALALTEAQRVDLPIGEKRLAAIRKQEDGSIIIDPTIQQLDGIAPDTVTSYLADDQPWGNVPGKNSDYILIADVDNSTGAYGERNQFFELNGDLFLCIINDETSATWVRNRSRNCLDSANATDQVVINLLLNSAWDNNILVIDSVRCKFGITYAGLDGYFYACIAVNANAYTWRRFDSANPVGIPLEITTGDHPTLIASLQAHDFSTGGYTEKNNASDETAEQGQTYIDQANNSGYVKSLNNKWFKIF